MKNINKQLTEMQKLHLETTLRVMEIAESVILSKYDHDTEKIEVNMPDIQHCVEIAAHIIGAVEEYGDNRGPWG